MHFAPAASCAGHWHRAVAAGGVPGRLRQRAADEPDLDGGHAHAGADPASPARQRSSADLRKLDVLCALCARCDNSTLFSLHAEAPGPCCNLGHSACRMLAGAHTGPPQSRWGAAEHEGVAAAAQAHRKQGDTDGAGLPPGVLTVCREIYQEGGLQVRCVRGGARALRG